MAEPTGGGPSFGEVDDVEPNVEPNGSGERADAATRQRIPDRRTEPGPQVGAPLPRAVPVWLLLGVALGAVVLTLAAVFFAFRAFSPAAPTATVAGASVAAPPVATAVEPAATIAPAATAAPAAPPTSVARDTIQPAAAAAACTTSAGEAQALGQARRWSDAAAKLESTRAQCDVVGPLYDAYLNQARTLADDERGGEAITFFDKALQVKSGTEASNERGLAVAYQDGRAALDRGDWDAAIANLSRVQSANPNYARGNNALNLVNAYLGQGDALVAQSRCAEALSVFQRADVVKPNESAVTQRISSAQQCGRPTLVPAPPPPPIAAAPPPPAPVFAAPVEPTVRAYYEALNSKRFGDAYSILSSPARASQSLASFAGRFDTNRGIGVRFIDGVSIQGSSAQLNAHTQTVTQNGTSVATSCSRVAWVLVLEGGQWRRDIRSESNNEFAERC